MHAAKLNMSITQYVNRKTVEESDHSISGSRLDSRTTPNPLIVIKNERENPNINNIRVKIIMFTSLLYCCHSDKYN